MANRDRLVKRFVARNYPGGTNKTPGAKGKGGWTISPDQRDRNGDWSQRQLRKRRPGGWV